MHTKSFSDKKYFIDFNELNKNLIRSEEQHKLRQKIRTSLLTFSKKYPRNLLKELADDMKMRQYLVERIIKQFIKDNLIPAKYNEQDDDFSLLDQCPEMLMHYQLLLSLMFYATICHNDSKILYMEFFYYVFSMI
ncbi:MAG: hypothetical protein ACFFAN_07985 [Promethearchaeota archaeon]